jgi:hypothetical protein
VVVQVAASGGEQAAEERELRERAHVLLVGHEAFPFPGFEWVSDAPLWPPTAIADRDPRA